jgi:GDP-4-dehydro-6-deoxy-D-mannose reductase
LSGPVLITGAGGFVGGHLRQLLPDAVAAEIDVLDGEALAAAVASMQPRAVVHLAAESSVGASWADAVATWRVNVLGTVTVLEAVRSQQPGARILFASTGEVYGRAERLPTPEDAPLAPLSPYAATKAAAEIACRQGAAGGLNVVITRAFNHEGPGRDERFAVGSWVEQIVRLEAAGGGELEVGNLDAKRDITDVRDVCRAYTLLLNGQVRAGTYNVASGKAVPMRRIAETLVSLARVPVEIVQKDDRVRPVEIQVLCGDATRLRQATGWRPEIPLQRTLADTLEHARVTVEVSPA